MSNTSESIVTPEELIENYTPLHSPIKWFGGKGSQTGMLRAFMPHQKHFKVYVEAFAGGASLLFAKEPKGFEVINDIHSGLHTLYTVLRDEYKFQRFNHLAQFTLYSEQTHSEAREMWEKAEDEIERAYLFFVLCRMSARGDITSANWDTNVTSSRRDLAPNVSAWISTVANLHAIHQRLREVQVSCRDFREVATCLEGCNTFFYHDPPYHLQTRSKFGGYHHEFNNQDHKDLIDICLASKGFVMLSGYRHKVHAPLDKRVERHDGWFRYDYEVKKRTESIWTNYDPKEFGEESDVLEGCGDCPQCDRKRTDSEAA
jgi:DNA adenine methylase